jgi:hypothetical protein
LHFVVAPPSRGLQNLHVIPLQGEPRAWTFSGEIAVTFAIWGTESDVATGSRIDKEMVAALPNGGYVVVWKDHNTLKFQIYNGLGAKVGTAKALPSTGGIQYIADIQAVGNEGNFAISWNDGLTSIRTRVFDADGTDVSGPNPIT